MEDEVTAEERQREGQGETGQRLGLALGVILDILVAQGFAHERMVRARVGL